jgi:hypothetical protein
MYVFLDESGDIGFSDASSKYLVIALVAVRDAKELERAVKRVRERKLKRKLIELPEFKASGSSPEIKRAVLEELMKKDMEVHAIVCNKSKVAGNLRDHTKALYNYVCRLIVEPAALTMGGEINLIVDKRTKKKSVRRKFDTYLLEMITQKALTLGDTGIRIKITHKDSCNDRGLQAVDFIANAIYRKYEHGDLQYYDIIKDKITTEKKLFF